MQIARRWKVVFFTSICCGLISIAIAWLLFLNQRTLLAKTSTVEKETKNCEELPRVIEGMPIRQGTFRRITGEETTFEYRWANTTEKIAHGFQYTCPETISNMNILFEFNYEGMPRFHMNNVFAPLDIAFIDKSGVIVDIFLMNTYSLLELKKPLYSPSKPVLYALEARSGFFQDLNITRGDQLLIRDKNKKVNLQ